MSDSVRVLHVLNCLNCGGAENMIMNLFRRIDRDKVCFDFLVHTEKQCFFDDEIEQLGGKIFRVPCYNGKNLLQYKRALNKFFAEHHDFIAVHGHLGSCSDLYLSEAKKYGLYTIAHCHNSRPDKLTLKSLVYKYACVRTRRIADYFFTCSVAGSIYRYGKRIAESDKCKLINNAIDTAKFIYTAEKRQSIRAKLGIENNQKVVGNVARFCQEKNHTFLVSIFDEIVKRDNTSVLLLVGDGSLRVTIEEQVKSLGIENNVIFTGIRNDIPDLIAAMDVFVMPSFFEGLPVTMVEAQASGLKCFISDGVPDDCILTDDVAKIALTESAEYWAVKIMNSWDYTRTPNTETLKTKGFDVETTAAWLTNFYLNCKR